MNKFAVRWNLNLVRSRSSHAQIDLLECISFLMSLYFVASIGHIRAAELVECLSSPAPAIAAAGQSRVIVAICDE